MAKKLISFFLSLIILVSSCFPAFAADAEDEPVEGSLEWLIEQVSETIQNGVDAKSIISSYISRVLEDYHADFICPKCGYEVTYTNTIIFSATCPNDGEALIIKTDDYTFTPVENEVSEGGNYTLPGYIDNSGTSHVNKEGKLEFIAYPRWLTWDSWDDGGKPNNYLLTDPFKYYYSEDESDDEYVGCYRWASYNSLEMLIPPLFTFGCTHSSAYRMPPHTFARRFWHSLALRPRNAKFHAKTKSRGGTYAGTNQQKPKSVSVHVRSLPREPTASYRLYQSKLALRLGAA